MGCSGSQSFKNLGTHLHNLANALCFEKWGLLPVVIRFNSAVSSHQKTQASKFLWKPPFTFGSTKSLFSLLLAIGCLCLISSSQHICVWQSHNYIVLCITSPGNNLVSWHMPQGLLLLLSNSALFLLSKACQIILDRKLLPSRPG